MPLLDDLLQRVLPPRQEDQLRREQQAILGGGDPTVQQIDTTRRQLDERASAAARQQQDGNTFASILQGLQATTSTSTSKLPDLLSLRSAPGQPQTSAPTYEVPLTASPIIGTKRYRTGNGAPALRQLAQATAQGMGWDARQFAAWDALINAESGWRPDAQNPTSTAFGLGQFLNSTWGSYGMKTTDPRLQLEYMARYIRDRYGTPEKALAFHNAKNYY